MTPYYNHVGHPDKSRIDNNTKSLKPSSSKLVSTNFTKSSHEHETNLTILS